MNTLKKVGILSYYPEKPAETGRPAYCQTVYVKKVKVYIKNFTIYEEVTYEPELKCYPEIPTIPAVPAEINNDTKTGWNAGAISNDSYKGDCEFSFDVPEGIVGCISGLSDGTNKKQYSHIAHGFLFMTDDDGHLNVSIIESGAIKQSLWINYYYRPRYIVRVIDDNVYYLIAYSDDYGTWYETQYISQCTIRGSIYAEALLYMVNDYVDNPEFIRLGNKLNNKLTLKTGLTNRTDNQVSGLFSIDSIFSTENYFYNPVALFTGQFVDRSCFLSVMPLQSNFVADNTPQIQVGSLFSPIPLPLQMPSLLINGGKGELAVSPIAIGCFMSDQQCYGEMKVTPLPALINRLTSQVEQADQIEHQEYLITQFSQGIDHAVFILFTEKLLVDHTIELGLVIQLDGQEQITLQDDISFNGIIELLIQEKIKLLTKATPANQQQYQYAVNATNFALSLYDNFDFIAFARCHGETYGIKPDGLYRLTGGTDNGQPITAEIDMGAKDWGVPNSKRVSSAYLGIRTDGEAYLKVVVDDRYTNIYRFEQAQSQARSFMAKGVTGRYWRMKLTLDEASFAELDSMEFDVGLSQRRVNK